jgi:glucose-1-phosphatase
VTSEPSSSAAQSNIKAVVFDLGGVVFRMDREERMSRFAPASTLSRMGIEAALFGTGLANDGDKGVFDAVTQHREAAARAHLSLDYGEMRDAWASAFTPDADVLRILDRISPGLLKASLSDNSELIRFGLEALWPAVMARFSRTFWSYEFHILKPAPEIFRRTAARLEVAPAEVCFVDDSIDNVEGARECGWDAIHFRGPRELEAALRLRGLLDGGAASQHEG